MLSPELRNQRPVWQLLAPARLWKLVSLGIKEPRQCLSVFLDDDETEYLIGDRS